MEKFLIFCLYNVFAYLIINFLFEFIKSNWSKTKFLYFVSISWFISYYLITDLSYTGIILLNFIYPSKVVSPDFDLIILTIGIIDFLIALFK